MTGMIPNRAAKLAVAMLAAAVFMAVAAGAASASTEVIYNNTNTVPATVNGFPNQDTFSEKVFYNVIFGASSWSRVLVQVVERGG